MSDFEVDLYAEHGEDFDSSSIDIVGYDRATKTLYVEFHSSDDVYSYEGVEESTYNLLVSSPSVGKFYAHHIKEAGYPGAKHTDGECIVPREDDDPIQPEQKWLTTDGDESPFAAEGEQDALRITADGMAIFGGTPNVSVIAPSRYVVQWTSEDFNGAGPFRPEFQAMSEADALAQFNAQVAATFGSNLNIKIQAVTHYFD